MPNARGWWAPLGLLGLALAAWDLAVRAWVPPQLLGRIFPSPSGIARAAWQKADVLAMHAAVTLGEVALGLALVLGAATALLVFSSRTLARAVPADRADAERAGVCRGPAAGDLDGV